MANTIGAIGSAAVAVKGLKDIKKLKISDETILEEVGLGLYGV